MKTNHTLFTAASIALIAAGISSCSSDYLDEKPNANSVVENTSSVIKDSGPMDYGNLGPKSQSDCLADCDFGLKAINTTDNVSCSRGGQEIANETLTLLGKSLLDYANSFVPKPLQGFTKGLMDKVMAGKDESAAKLNEISDDIKQVSKLVAQLKQGQDGNAYTTYYNNHMKDHNSLELNNCNYFNRYYDYLAKGDLDSAKVQLIEWAGKMSNGNNDDIATILFMREVANQRTSPESGCISIADIYDYWVFNTHAWEHQGYTMREQLRLADVEVVVCGCALAKAYYEMKNYKGEEKDLEDAFKGFYDYYYNQKHIEVPRHNDVLVCQIQDAHVVLNKKLVSCDRKNYWTTTSWANTTFNDRDIRTNEILYGEQGLDMKESLFKSLYKSEVAAIYKFYNNGKSEDKKVTMENILKDTLGLEMNIDTSKRLHVMTLRDGGSYMNSDDNGRNTEVWSLYYGTVSVMNTSEYLLNNWRLGLFKFHVCDILDLSCTGHYRAEGWHLYKSDQTQFFRTDVQWRYRNWEPDVEANKVTKF